MPSITRREFLVAGAAAGSLVVTGFPSIALGKAPALELAALPWAENALEPYISSKTIGFHYGKHHKTYLENTNKNIAGTEYADLPLEKIIAATAGKPDKAAIFNNAAQLWNHTFYWKSMHPKGGGPPTGAAKDRVAADFAGGYDGFVKELTAAATGQFGSGWAWLIEDGGKLKVVKTPNAENPLGAGKKALATCDVWEHAYYLDYQNRRADYAKAFIEHLLNWDFVNENLAKKS